MKVLLLGSTGMLGQALYKKLKNKQMRVITIARSKSDYNVDLIVESEKIINIIKMEDPDIVINAAALVNLQVCEDYPEKAYLLNARIPSFIAEACKEVKAFFVQISTDHYYIKDGESKHKESDDVYLVNEYARTKFAGEFFALTYSESLIVRTNIVGFRNKQNKPTFIEWIIDSLENKKLIFGFQDFYTSSIDVYHFADILMELIEKKITGIINVASENELSKYEFIYRLATLLGKEKYVKRSKMN
ncbi:SDR family oxidoreductase, partial [Metabacillus fastidiosus]|uniref:SDR family oxidoreductase n=1 Tax=Metabacillus fastidiosus TaxID=1458 RepID=UPI002DBF42FB